MKRCTRCKTEKSEEEFSRDRSRPDGLDARCRVCKNEMNTTWRRANPEEAKRRVREAQRSRRMRDLGITQEEYDDLLERQGGSCAICSTPPVEPARLAIDHDHTTGEVRGLLCIPCNLAIGNLQDDPTLVLRAADYLMAFKTEVTIS